MAEELGRIEKPPVEDFRHGRKLFLVPLIFLTHEPEPEYREKYKKYWAQVEMQLADFEVKLGSVKRVYHELVASAGQETIKAVKDINEESSAIVANRTAKGAQLVALEDCEILTEYMDWSRCLSIGFESPKAFNKVYELYTEASKRRNEAMARRIDETLQTDEIGIVLIREGHQVQFPPDIQVFYVAPPALDEIHRWLRERRERPHPEPSKEEPPQEKPVEEKPPQEPDKPGA